MGMIIRALDWFSISLGRWFGIPITIHGSLTLVFLYLLIFGKSYEHAVIYASVLFLVLLHELGHSFAADIFKIRTKSIVLMPIGGMASIERMPTVPKEEFTVAIAGPAVNAFLIAPLFAVAPFHDILYSVAVSNVALLVFNLLPAFPMDGGRILRAGLHGWRKDYVWATTVAGRTGQVFCGLFGLLAIASGQWMLLVLAIFVFTAAESEIRNVKTKFLRDTAVTFVPRSEAGIPSDEVGNSYRAILDVNRLIDEHERRYRS